MNIGFLTANIHSGSGPILWQSMAEHVRSEGDRLFIFAGGRLLHDDPVEMRMNRVFSLAATDAVDATIVWASALSGTVSPEGVQAYLGRFSNKPLVSIEMSMPNVPSVSIDVYSGMQRLLDHVVQVHGARRIAFLRGPAKHRSSEDRFHAFRDYISEHKLGWDERLVSSPVEWSMGAKAVRQLVEANGMHPGRDFDVLVGTSDLLIYNAVLELSQLGWNCPDDYTAAGFNNSPESELLNPSITTVRMPFRELSKAAVQLLGTENTEDLRFSTQLIVRRSCGCYSHSYSDVLQPDQGRSSEAGWSRKELEHEIRTILGRTFQSGDPNQRNWAEPLLNALLQLVDRVDTGAVFLRRFDAMVTESIQEHVEAREWQEALAAVHGCCRKILPPDLARALVSIFERAHMYVSDAVEKVLKAAAWRQGKSSEQLQLLDNRLLTVGDFSDLSSILASVLPDLGVDWVYAVLYEERAWSVVAGYDSIGLYADSGNGDDRAGVFPPDCLLPIELINEIPEGGSSFVLPLCDETRQYGHVVVALGTADGKIYEQIRLGLTGVMRNLVALRDVTRAIELAQKAEAVKTRFLQNASSELLEPLRRIRAAVPAWKGPSETAVSVETEFDHVLLLLNDMDDLAHSQADALTLDPAALQPIPFLASLLNGNGFRNVCIPKRSLPMVDADPVRLSQILQGLLQIYSVPGTGLELVGEGRYSEVGVYLVLKIRGAQLPDTSGLEGDPIHALHRKIMILHGGELRTRLFKDEHQFELMFPYPTIDGSFSAIEMGRSVARMSPCSFDHGGSDLSMLPVTEPSTLSDLSTAGALLYDLDQLAPSDWKDVLRLRTVPTAHQLPLLLFSSQTHAEDTSTLSPQLRCGELLFRCAADRVPGPVVWFPDRESPWGSLEGLIDPAELLRLVNVEDLHLLDVQQPPSVIIVQNQNMDIVSAVRNNLGWAQVPILLIGTDFGFLNSAGGSLDFVRLSLLHQGVFLDHDFVERLEVLRRAQQVCSPQIRTLVNKAVLYFDRHYQTNVSRWKLASSVHVSEDYLTRVFHKDMGISPWEYLSRLRIARSCELLRSSARSIQEIAQMVGFSDQAYYCRVFRKITGRTPSKYRSLRTV